jgi:hypothetical protein
VVVFPRVWAVLGWAMWVGWSVLLLLRLLAESLPQGKFWESEKWKVSREKWRVRRIRKERVIRGVDGRCAHIGAFAASRRSFCIGWSSWEG